MQLAEALVDEWLNRSAYLTVRGWRSGVNEMDLLGVRTVAGRVEGIHVEVQASMRPIGYISKLLPERVPSFAKMATSAKTRPDDVLEEAVSAWVDKKFHHRSKVEARNRLWPGLNWRLMLVHARVKDDRELAFIQARGIELAGLDQVLQQLGHVDGAHRGNAGTDLSEIIEYFAHASRSF
jgi:hypothetical protein